MAPAVVRNRRWVALAWVIAAAALLPAAYRAEEAFDVAAQLDGSESAAVQAALADGFGSPFAHSAVLVASGIPTPDQPKGRVVLARIAAAVATAPGVTRTFSHLDAPDTLFVGSGGAGTFLVVGLDPGDRPVDALIPGLRETTRALLPKLRRDFPDAAVRWTGEAALNTDLRRASAEDANAAERRALPITLALLLLAFGAVAAAALPAITGVLAISIALGAAVLLTRVWPLSILLVNIVTMIGLGLGIDYALLTVSRFREALASGREPEDAAADAARHAGHTIAVSGAAVAIGFAALMVVPLNELRSIAVGGLLVVATSALLATTLLPGVLARVGRRIDSGRNFRRSSHPIPTDAAAKGIRNLVIRGPAHPGPLHRPPLAARGRGDAAGDPWRRWARRVAAHPVLVLAIAGAPVAGLALQAPRLSTALPRGDWLPPGMESARALEDLEAMERSGIVHGIRLLLELPAGVPALKEEGLAATVRLGDALGSDPRVARIRSLPTRLAAAGARAPALDRGTLLASVPEPLVRSFVSRDESATLIELVPREGAVPAALMDLVREIRAADAARLTGVPGARLRVGGIPAFNVDYDNAVSGHFRRVVALVVAATLLALMIGFRSVLVAIKAVALNLLSVAAAFGALVLVFQDGHGAALLGLDGPTGGIFPVVPILVFCTVFGLSMDYEVFLVARVAEARRAGLGPVESLAEGLARTGGVITSAAAIMIAVFAAFVLGDFLLIKMLGFTLAVAVLIDATVVRIAIGPALLRLAGDWNWWPGGRREAAGVVQRAVEARVRIG